MDLLQIECYPITKREMYLIFTSQKRTQPSITTLQKNKENLVLPRI